jgi:DNA repair protein SbcC/Rad50
MIPLRLTLRNFLSYREATLDFRGLHTACICGANGAGKSSLLEAIAWALWGDSRATSEDDVIHLGETEAQVEFIFQIHQQIYRVIRTRCRRQGMAIEFQIALDPDSQPDQLPKQFRPLTEKGLRATQQLILDRIKLDHETFVNSAYLRQGRADEFMLKRPSDRKQILSDLLKLQQYEELAEQAKEQARHFKIEVELLERRQDAIGLQLEPLSNLAAQQTAITEQRILLEQRLQTGQTQLQILQQQHQQQQNLQQQLNWYRQQQQQSQADCQTLQQEYQKAEQQHQTLNELLQAEAEIIAGYEQWQQFLGAEEDYASRFACFQTLQNQRQHYAQEQRDRLHLLQQQQQQLIIQEASVLEQLDEVQQALSKSAEIETGLEHLHQARQALQRYDQVQLQVAPLLQRKQFLQRELDRATAKMTARLEELRISAQQLQTQHSRQPLLQQAVVEVCDRIEELDKLRKYQEQVRDKGLERRNFMERLQAHQRDYEAQLAEVDQILRLLKHRTEEGSLSAELQEAMSRHSHHHFHENSHNHSHNHSQDGPVEASIVEVVQDLDALPSFERTGSEVAIACEAKNVYQTKPMRPEIATEPVSDALGSSATEFPPCPLCDRSLDEPHWQLVVEKHLSKQQEILEQIWIIREQLAVSEREIQVLRQEYREIEKKLNPYGATLEKRGRLQEQLQFNQGIQQNLHHLQAEVQQLEQQLLQGQYAAEIQEELKLLERTLEQLQYDDRDHALARSAADRWRWAEIKQAEIKQAHRRKLQLEERLPELRSQLEAVTYHFTHLMAETHTGLAQFDQHLQDLGYESEQHNALRSALKQAQPWQLRYQELQQARQQLPSLQQHLTHLFQRLQSRMAQLEDLRHQLHEVSQQLTDAIDVAPLIQELETNLQRDRHALDTCLAELGKLHQQQQQQQQLQTEAQTIAQQLQECRQQHRIYQELTLAFGKNGIQALMIENVLPQLETIANQILSRLTNNQLHVQFITQRRPQKSKLSASKLASGQSQPAAFQTAKLGETLDILIADAQGTRPYETYSGGEAFRINFAIRLALSRLLSQRSGTALQLLIIDEGFGTQDQEGCDRLIAAINAIASDFACILTITHMPYFRDAFQSRIEVYKDEAGSQISLCL